MYLMIMGSSGESLEKSERLYRKYKREGKRVFTVSYMWFGLLREWLNKYGYCKADLPIVFKLENEKSEEECISSLEERTALSATKRKYW